MHNLTPEDLLAKWLDGHLNTQEREQFELLCVEDKAFAQRVEAANQIQMAAADFDAGPVPDWNRDITFNPATQPARWWQWQGLPALSMAMSACAMLLVVTGFRVTSNESGLTLGFGHGMSEAQITAAIEAKETSLEQASQQLFTRYADALVAQQQKNSAELTQYLLTSSRQERREDFAELIKFINEQRSDDQRFYARQINNLQQEINSMGGEYTPGTLPREQIVE